MLGAGASSDSEITPAPNPRITASRLASRLLISMTGLTVTPALLNARSNAWRVVETVGRNTMSRPSSSSRRMLRRLRERMVGVDDHEHPMAVVELAVQLRIVHRPTHHAHVAVEVAQPTHDLVLEAQPHRGGDGRVLTAKHLQHLHHVERPHRVQGEMAGLQVPRGPQQRDCLLLVPVQAASDREQGLAGRRELHAAAPAMKQLHAEVRFQGLHVGGNGRLSDVQGLRRTREAAGGRHHVKRLQPLLVHRSDQ